MLDLFIHSTRSTHVLLFYLWKVTYTKIRLVRFATVMRPLQLGQDRC